MSEPVGTDSSATRHRHRRRRRRPFLVRLRSRLWQRLTSKAILSVVIVVGVVAAAVGIALLLSGISL